jgi:HEAT repeat protein
VDTAGPLRARCALALVGCKDLSDHRLLEHLIEVLVDPDKTVRVEAARAIGRVDRPEAALLLRLRALTGDPEPEVIGTCFQALLGIDSAVGFVSQFLERGGDVGAEAALALGMTRRPEAFAILKDHWKRQRDPQFGAALLSGIGLTNLPEAIDFLIGVVAADGRGSTDALQALSSARLTEEDRARIQAAVEATGNPRLRAAWKKQHRGNC